MRAPRIPVRLAQPVAAATFAGLGLLLAGCTGPQLTLANPGGHELFVDGERVVADPEQPLVLDYRYYGTTRWDALPEVVVEHGVPRFDDLPTSREVELPLPVPRWLFPLDFPLELVERAVFGRRDQTETVTVDRAEQPPTAQAPPAALTGVRVRALSARASR